MIYCLYSGPSPELIFNISILTDESIGVTKKLRAQGEPTFVKSPQPVEKIVYLCSEKESDPRRLETPLGNRTRRWREHGSFCFSSISSST